MHSIATNKPYSEVLREWEEANPSPWKVRAVCPHEETAQTKRLDSLGRIHYQIQCLACGRKVAPLKKTDVERDKPIREFDHAKENAFRDAESAAIAEEMERWRASRQALWGDYYHAYLRSPQWAARRAAILRRSEGWCANAGKCGNRASHVHHETYQRLGEEKAEDLTPLCDACHSAIHRHMRQPRSKW